MMSWRNSFRESFSVFVLTLSGCGQTSESADLGADVGAEASVPACGAGCGGDPRGEWVARAMPCSSPETREHAFGLCDPVSTVSELERLDGAATFTDDGSVVFDPPLRMTVRERMIYPKSCLALEGWSTCTDLSAFHQGTCIDVGTDCECQSMRERMVPIESGTWTVEGSTLEIRSPQTFGNPVEHQYCVRNDRLTLTRGETFELAMR